MKLLIILTLMTCHAWAFDNANLAKFSGRISRLNSNAKLMRIKVDFENAKFLNKGNRLDFWNETYPNNKCTSIVEGKSNEYLLVSIPRYAKCIKNIHVTVGTYLHMYSKDLEQNLQLGQEVVEILLKKRLATEGIMRRYQKKLDNHVEKIDAVNKRYEVLRQKLDIEWQQEIAALEEDKMNNYQHYQHSLTNLNDIDHKLHRYRIEDESLKVDRWSLDPRLYMKK